MNLLNVYEKYLHTSEMMKSWMPTSNSSNTRVLANLSPEERATFADALHLCPTNALVDDINIAHLRSSNRPVLIVPMMHTGPGATKTSEDDAEGLQSKLLLMEGAKVMLTRNLWTAQGLTNGTMGIIRTNPLHLF